MNEATESVTGLKIDSEMLSRLRTIVDSESDIIVEHRFYRGSRSPKRIIFDDYEEFESYLESSALPGDSIWIWHYENLCNEQNAIISGAKKTDALGQIPVGGAY